MAFIINKYNVFHSIPDDMPLPAGARVATAKEVEEWQKTDATNKAALLAQKQQAKRDRAQFVVELTPAPVEPTVPETDKGKGKPDGKPTA